jgi:hypothetical protein
MAGREAHFTNKINKGVYLVTFLVRSQKCFHKWHVYKWMVPVYKTTSSFT